jgi:phosphatidylglycerophosphate synthase
MSTESKFPIRRLVVGLALAACAFVPAVRNGNPLLTAVAAVWGSLFVISAVLHRTEFGELLATVHRDERQSRLEASASQSAFVAVLAGAVATIVLRPSWPAANLAALLMLAGVVVYIGSLAVGVARK